MDKIKLWDGFYLDVHIIVYVSVIIVGAFVLNKSIRWLMNRSLVSASDKIKVDATRYRFFKNAVSLLIWFVAILCVIYAIPSLRSLALTLFAGAGIMVVILGFAAQEAFSNIISGIFIVMFRPFRVGDLIQVGSRDYGVVQDITLRHTVILNFENKQIIIPNSVLSTETVINDTIGDQKICRFIEVGISYDSDLKLAMRILQEEAENHPLTVDGRTEKEKADNTPVVVIRLLSFADSAMILRANVWIKDPLDGRAVHSDVYIAVKKRFDEEGIEIPFPHRTLVYKDKKQPL